MKNNNRLLVSIFPDEKWICSSSKTGDMITSECDEEKKINFSSRNDTSSQAIRNAQIFDCTKDFANVPVEFNSENGDKIFTDRGKKITFDRAVVTDDAIREALSHAAQKFDNKLLLTGNCELFTKRMAIMADDMGIIVLNPEMHSIIAAHRESLANAAPSLSPPRGLKKRGGFLRRIFSWKK